MALLARRILGVQGFIAFLTSGSKAEPQIPHQQSGNGEKEEKGGNNDRLEGVGVRDASREDSDNGAGDEKRVIRCP